MDAVREELARQLCAVRAELDQTRADRDAWMHVATRYRTAALEGLQSLQAIKAREVDAFLRGDVTHGRGK